MINNEIIEIKITENKLILKNKISKNIKTIDEERLFETFYQADNSRSSKGYGLALSIVKKIVKLHNFDINIEIKNNLFIVSIRF